MAWKYSPEMDILNKCQFLLTETTADFLNIFVTLPIRLYFTNLSSPQEFSHHFWWELPKILSKFLIHWVSSWDV